MTSVLTGDIINSREVKADQWMSKLLSVLSHYGSSPKHWEIFRGDSFQLEVDPQESLKAAISIKSHIKTISELDVRISIGVGEKDYNDEKITLSNGTAFINSGECFDSLHKKNLGIATPWKSFNEIINLSLELASLSMDQWTPNSAEIISVLLEEPTLTQVALAKRLNKSQGNISAALTRAGYQVIMKLERYFKKELQILISNY